MDTVFLLWFIRAPDTDDESEFFIGVYSTDEEAKAAIARLRGKPGFSNAPGGFQICPYKINKDHWTEGFGFTDD